MKKSGLFYLSVIDKPVSVVWYKKTSLGKNTINTIREKNERELTSVSGKEFDHSGQEAEKFWYPEV